MGSVNQSIQFIINPRSGGGTVGKNWDSIQERLERSLGKFEFIFTSKKGSGSELGKQFADEGRQILVIVGGDGTVSEVVDGVMRGKTKPKLGILNLGTGGDFSRTIGIPGDLDLAIEKIKANTTRLVDVGRIEYYDPILKQEKDRYFINVAGCGMAGEVVYTVNRSSKRFGAFSYYLGSAANILKYKNKIVKIQLDHKEPIERKITTLAICNGQFFGGGMQISPQSEISDGYFDVVILGDWNLLQKAYYSKNFYNGTILETNKVESYRCKVVEVYPLGEDSPVRIDCDGEDLGVIPMRAEILSSAIGFLV